MRWRTRTAALGVLFGSDTKISLIITLAVGAEIRKMQFLEGEQVFAKHPNTSEYYRGKILNVKGEKYTVQFPGGKQYKIFQSDIKPGRTSRSTTRTSTRRAVGKSPPRSSPSRKSPSRRSPGRSPARSRKLPVRNTRLANKVSTPYVTLSRDIFGDDNKGNSNVELKEDREDDPLDLLPLESRIKDIGPATRRSIRVMSNTIKTTVTRYSDKSALLSRNIDRAASLPVDRNKELYEYNLKNKERGMSVQVNHDLTNVAPYETKREASGTLVGEKTKKEIDFVGKPQEWGGWLGALFLIFALPIGIILPQIIYSTDASDIWSIYRAPTELKSYLTASAFFMYCGFLCILALVSVLPIGRLVDGQQSKIGRLQYRTNGILAALLSLCILGICEYVGYNVSDLIFDNWLQLSISGWLLGTIIASALYVKGGRAPVAALNMYASTNNNIYDFWQGREINPRVGLLDFKMILLRAAVIGTLVLNSTMIIKTIEDVGSTDIRDYNIPLLLAASLQIFHCLDSLVFESSVFTTFEILYEGTGYMLCVGHLTYPFLPTLVTRYLHFHGNVEPPEFYLVVLFVSFFGGYIVYRSSNSQKDEFRKNPFSPALSHLETIPTQRGKRLIASGLWGHVRHPNYLGDVMMQWSIACMCFTTDILAYYAALCCTLTLIYRALRDNTRCKMRYGAAWDEYCARVKFMILNRIF